MNNKSLKRMSSPLRVLGLLVLVMVACTRSVFSQTPERVGTEVLTETLVFAPRVISTDAFEYGTAFTPDGSTVYFTRRPREADSDAEPPNTIYESHLQNGEWTAPRVAFFSGTYDDRDPFISPDGDRLFFLNSTGLNIFPRISPDGAHLYYSNTDSMGSTNADILRTPLGALLRAYRAPAANDAVLVVANRSGHNVALIDPESYTLLGTLPVGKGPHELAVSTSGSTVFVANYGIYPEVLDDSAPRTLTWKTEITNTVTVLDVERRAVVATHHLDNCTNPHGIEASSDGMRFWVTCENHETVLELDAVTGKPIKRWPTKQARSHMVLHDEATQKLFVANGNAGSVTVIDRSADRVQVIPTGAGAEGMTLTPDGGTLWVLNSRDNTMENALSFRHPGETK